MREPGEGEACKGTRFVVSGEISSIYKQDGRVRKVHSLILLPGLEEAKLLSKRLEAIGNIHSDGRPILGLSCRDLLEIMLETCPDGIFVPAHIWTPHFSMFGACSGFDTVEECFGDLAPHIHAVGNGAFLRSAHELAAFGSGPFPAYFQFRRPLSCKAGKRSEPAGYRAVLCGA